MITARFFTVAFLFVFFFVMHLCDLLGETSNKCEGTKCEYQKYLYNSYSVTTITLNELKSKIAVSSAEPYDETGKFYFYNDLMFVNQPNKGLHILDVSDPSNFQNAKFLSMPGNIDVSVRNNMLYADVYSALLAIDVSEILNEKIKIVDTQTEVFHYNHYQEAWKYVEAHKPKNKLPKEIEYSELANIDGLGKTVFISGIEYNGVTCRCQPEIEPYSDRLYSSGVENVKNISGQGGSVARFKVVDDYLYALTENEIKTFKFKDDGTLQKWSSVVVGWGIETLYRLNEYLFIGSRRGMFMYDISDAGNPTFISQYEHVRACDPVVAQDNYAYVTLRSTNSWCAGGVNQLQIVDISNAAIPNLVSVYNMNAPYGLAIKQDYVFVCDADSGLKIFDVSDKKKPKVVHTISDINPRDIILRENIAYVVTTKGLATYDISDISSPKRLK